MNWEWDDLRFFLAVARGGTISEGAKALQVNPTTVSRRIRALEERLGVDLFEKLRHGAILSAAGQDMAEVAARMERMTLDLDARIQGLNSRLEGTIRVASIEPFHRHWMPDYQEFRRRYPGIHLELTASMAMVNVSQREADVALRLASSAPEHLIGKKHAEVLHAVYGSRELLQRIDPSTAYEGFPWLSYDLAVFAGIDHWLTSQGMSPEIVMRVPSIRVMEDAIEAGMGICLLNCLVGDSNPRLRRIGKATVRGTHLWVLTLPQLRGSARILAFTRFMRAVVQRDRELLEGRRPQW